MKIVLLCVVLLLSSCISAQSSGTRAPRPRPVGLDAEIEQSSHQQIVVSGSEDRYASAYILTDFGVWGVARRDGKVYRVD